MRPCSTSMPQPALSPSNRRPTTKRLAMRAATTSMTSALRRLMAAIPRPRPLPSRSPMSMKRQLSPRLQPQALPRMPAGTVYTAAATDPDAGTTLTYSISGADASLFNINATTGAVTFKSSPNYEAPDDAGGNNVYDVNVTASDGTNSATKAVAISVTNVNEAPTVTSAATASFAENGSWNGLHCCRDRSGCRSHADLFDLGRRCFPVQYQCHNRRCHLQIVTKLRSAWRCRRQQRL